MMKKNIRIIVATISAIAIGTIIPIEAKITFGSTQSAIKISNGGALHLGGDVTNVDGTISHDASGVITGEASTTIEFSQGVLQSNNAEVGLTAGYDPNLSGKTIVLNGNDLLQAEPGTIVENVRISGASNRITGQPLFSTPLLLADANSSLTMAIHSRLNQNINLNGGTLTLDHDLELSDYINLLGGGTVLLNNHQLAFGSGELNHTDNIHWISANAEYLHGKTNLASTWFYSGESTLNGNGNVLDLSLGGTIFVNENSTLYISDLFIKGLGDGGIQFADKTSNIILSNVEIELAQNYTTTTGGLYVEGPSTFILENKSWFFDQNGSLSVDGVVLWTDRKGTPTTTRGFVEFGSPKENFYSSINSGTIKAKVYLSDLDSLETLININAGDIALLEDRVDIAETNIINNSHAIVAVHDLAVSNSYAILYLEQQITDPAFPWAGTITTDKFICESGHLDPCDQMIIAGDVTLNGSGSMIVFSNPDEPQFIVQPGKTVTLEEINFQNVNAKTFELGKCSQVKIGKNVTFGITQDVTFEGYKMQLIDGPFTMYGIGGIRRVGFTGITVCERCEGSARNNRRIRHVRKMFTIGDNTFAIKNIELLRIEDVGNNQAGRIKLQGTSVVNIHENCSRSFIVEGIDNIFRMRNNNIAMLGSLIFGDNAHNVLHILHKIPEGLTQSPQVTFGNSFANVASQQGVAELQFDDDVIRVTNQGCNSFIVGNNSFLGGRQLAIWNNPILQISDNFDTADDLELTSNLPNPIEPAEEPCKSLPLRTAFTPGLIGNNVSPVDYQPLILRTRTPDTSQKYDGNVSLEQTTVDNVSIHPTNQLTMMLNGNATVSLAPTNVVVKPEDIIYVSGKNNVIRITKTLTMHGSLFFEHGAHLALEIEDQMPEDALKLPKGITLNPDAPIEVRVIG